MNFVNCTGNGALKNVALIGSAVGVACGARVVMNRRNLSGRISPTPAMGGVNRPGKALASPTLLFSHEQPMKSPANTPGQPENPVDLVTFSTTGQKPQEKNIYKKILYTQADPVLLKPKGQVLKLRSSLLEAIADPAQPVPDQVVLRLIYEQTPPVAGIRNFLKTLSEEAKGNGVKMVGARLFLGMPKQLPPMDLLYEPTEPLAITFVVDTKAVDRKDLNQFANFLKKGLRFLPEAYEE